MAEINGTVTRMLFDSYGVERLCESHMEWNSYLLRCFRYRTRRPDEPDLGLWSHTDRTFISTLHQNQISGLQIKTKDGQWIDVEPSGSSFLVLAGDVLMVCYFSFNHHIYIYTTIFFVWHLQVSS